MGSQRSLNAGLYTQCAALYTRCWLAHTVRWLVHTVSNLPFCRLCIVGIGISVFRSHFKLRVVPETSHAITLYVEPDNIYTTHLSNVAKALFMPRKLLYNGDIACTHRVLACTHIMAVIITHGITTVAKCSLAHTVCGLVHTMCWLAHATCAGLQHWMLAKQARRRVGSDRNNNTWD